MQDLNSPAVNCNILACYDKRVRDKQACQEVNLFGTHQVLDRQVKVKKNGAANDLGWNDPAFSLTDAL